MATLGPEVYQEDLLLAMYLDPPEIIRPSLASMAFQAAQRQFTEGQSESTPKAAEETICLQGLVSFTHLPEGVPEKWVFIIADIENAS